MARSDLKAFEDRNGAFIFVPVPDEHGRYVRTSWFVSIVACPACGSGPGVPCRGAKGYCGSIHADRAVAAKDLLWRGGMNTNSNCVNGEPHPIIKDDIVDAEDGAGDIIGHPKSEEPESADGTVRTTVDLRGVIGE